MSKKERNKQKEAEDGPLQKITVDYVRSLSKVH